MGSEMTPLLVFEGGASEAPPRGTTRIRYAVGGRVKVISYLAIDKFLKLCKSFVMAEIFYYVASLFSGLQQFQTCLTEKIVYC